MVNIEDHKGLMFRQTGACKVGRIFSIGVMSADFLIWVMKVH